MDAFIVAIGFALLPALGSFAGGLVAEFTNLPDKALSFALHLAAGIIFAVVGLELMTTALQGPYAWLVCLAFIAGGAVAVGLDKLIGYITRRFNGGGAQSGPWMIYAGVSIELFSDGVMIGTGSTIASSLALLLALAQVAGNVPEGFATMASFKKQAMPRAQRLLIGASFAVPILIGTTVGYWAVRGQPEIYKFLLLAVTAGILTTVAVEEMVRQAHAVREAGDEESGWQTIGLVSGFALFAAISVYLE